MDYVEKVTATIQKELVKAGFNIGGENGADKVITKILVDELAKLNARLEDLEKK